jgi:syntaxin 16
MAFRDLTREFLDIRSRYVAKLHPDDSYDSGADDYELRYMNPSSSSASSWKKSSTHALKEDIELGDNEQYLDVKVPQWNLIMKNVKENISNIQNGLEVLKRLHTQHTTFSLKKDDAHEEQQVQIQTEQLKQLFLICKKAVERIDTTKEPKTEEDIMKRNCKISLVNELNELSKVFRDEQSEYLKNVQRLKLKKNMNKVNYSEPSYRDLDPEEAERLQELELKLQQDPSFTDEQIREMLDNEKDVLRRDQELRDILKTIVELNELFKEFSTLVVEQGTLLDRIDYNIETTLDRVKSGNADLLTAEKYQKMSRMTLCILFLIILVVAFGLFFALKLILRFSFSPVV